MNVLVDIGHPAHVHLFKNLALIMMQHGHSLFFTVREGESETILLSAYELNYKLIGHKRKTKLGKITGILYFTFKILLIAIKYKPDIFLSHGSVYAGIAAFLLGKPHIAMEDSGNMEQIRLSKPVSSVILSPDILPVNLGRKQIKYSSYHELAYLHPNYFNPDKRIIEKLGLEEKKYCILRFSSFNASHDIGQKGFSPDQKIKIVDELKKRFKVLISSEKSLPAELSEYQVNFHPVMMHHVLAFARIVISEGATIASESGVMGVPTIYVNSIVRCYNEDQSKYNTVYNFRSGTGVLDKILEIISDDKYSRYAKAGQKKLLSEKTDLTAFLVWFIENYHNSRNTMQKTPDYQLLFK
jgi:uncharacterized protein